ncbi:MAG: efflux RND transporter periplasmic adaptor subunit [Chloroflexi bacterium]|nr:efflux RND transporter periplasmic adaptor subunit [Chloroflexota bacterium]
MTDILALFRSLRVWHLAALALVAVVSAGGGYWAYTTVSAAGQPSLAKSQQLIPVTLGNLVNQVSTSGSLLFSTKETLTFSTAGTVAEVLVKNGQQVEKDQPLARLDAPTMTSLEKTVAQARVNLRNAQDALERAKTPSAQAIAQAQAGAAIAKVALRNAQDALEKIKAPSDQAVAQAQAGLANAKVALRNAQNALDTLASSYNADAVAKAQAQGDAAALNLANTQQAAALARQDGASKVQAAQDALTPSQKAYQDVYSKWLGITATPAEASLPPQTLLDSWGVNLESLFSPQQRFQDMGQWINTQGPPANDPTTPWSEPVIYNWLNFYPVGIAAFCDNVVSPQQGACLQKEMDDAWNAMQTQQANLATMQNTVATSNARQDSLVSQAQSTLEATQQALATLKAGPDPLDVDAKTRGIAVAQANLTQTQADLATLLAGPDPIDVDAKAQAVVVAEANLSQAQADLATLLAGPDPIDVDAKAQAVVVAEANLSQAQADLATLLAGSDALDAELREKDVASSQAALDTALQRLDGATIKSPLAGIVAVVNIVAGQNVSASTQAVQVVDPTLVEMNGNVNEVDVLFVREGTSAAVTMDALPGQTLNGTVTYVSSGASTQQGVVSYPVSIQLQVPAGIQLREGLSATANIVIREESNVLLVPNQAIYGSFQQPTVKVMNNGKVVERTVTLGNTDDFWVVVKDGLAQGDKVVLETTQATASGQIQFRTGGFPGQGGASSFTVIGAPQTGGQRQAVTSGAGANRNANQNR